MGHLQAKDLTVGRYEEIEKLVELVAASRIHELTAQAGETRITITAGPARRKPARPPAPKPQSDSIAPTLIESEAAPEIHRITAPMVGVFHHAEPPINAGMDVRAGQVIAVIESMKLMNDIRSEETGTIQAMHVDDGLAVEYGQPLFDILPSTEETDEEE